MNRFSLNGAWQLREAGGGQWLPAQVPGTVYSALLAAGLAPDAYYRGNETEIAPIFEKDYEYRRVFTLPPEVTACRHIALCCDGLDTMAELLVNGQPLAQTSNMHRRYRFPLAGRLQPGENELCIRFRSATAYVREYEAANPGQRGTAQLRKATCMFGWDWGLALPDMGIWRDIYIEGYSEARLESLYITQHHRDGQVGLEVEAHLEGHCEGLTLCAELFGPGGAPVAQASLPAGKATFHITLKEPQLWWPTGQGEQPLYTLRVGLLRGEEELDWREQRVGLRSIRLRREEDEFGRGFAFEVNGRRIFAMGSNMVIEDAVLPRRSRKKMEALLRDCVDAHFNCVRVWGGAIYPDDYFFDLCDELGLLVIQDFMFANRFPVLDEAFLENVTREAEDNIRRIRGHASLALWCGNNELELIYNVFLGQDESLRRLAGELGFPVPGPTAAAPLVPVMQRLFYKLLPQLLQRLDPQTDYLPGSPVADKPFGFISYDETPRGDTHYYLAYDARQPYPTIRQKKFRFIAEFGFQSYPDYETVCAFTRPEDRGPYTPVILQHQKCREGNPIIEQYMAQDFPVPEDFPLYTYASQVLAGHILAYSIEHFRRLRGLCMGFLTWQMNDCWPVVSWSGIDYYGRWKAQQYYLKRAFAPVLALAIEEEGRVELHLVNDGPAPVTGSLEWRLLRDEDTVLEQRTEQYTLPPGTARQVQMLDFAPSMGADDKGRFLFAYRFVPDNAEASGGCTLFCKPKAYPFKEPHIHAEVAETESGFHITLSAKAYARAVALALKGYDARFSDNYFDILPGGAVQVFLPKGKPLPPNAAALKACLQITSLFSLWPQTSQEGESACSFPAEPGPL